MAAVAVNLVYGYVAFPLDESVTGLAFPEEERAALVASELHRFQLAPESDMRVNRVHADLAALDQTEARDLVVDALRAWLAIGC